MVDVFQCPKCDRALPRSGMATIDQVEYPVFQCPECIRTFEMDGQTFEEAYTFAVGVDGEPFDPGDSS